MKKRVDDSLATDDMAKVVGEFAFGINPKARFVEEFLETEKIKGTIHIAFGDNLDFPSGKNNSANHMDFLINKPTVKVHKKNKLTVEILKEGIFQIPNLSKLETVVDRNEHDSLRWAKQLKSRQANTLLTIKITKVNSHEK